MQRSWNRIFNYVLQRSHFILGGLNYYVLASENKLNVLIVFILYCGGIRVRLGTGLEVWVGLRVG